MKLIRFNVIAAALIVLLVTSAKASIPLYMMTYSSVATEGNIQFDARVGMSSSSLPSQSAAINQAKKQLKFMQSSFRREKVASVRSDWSVTITKIETVSPGLYRIHYHFSGIGMIINSQGQLQVYLPKNPDTVETPARVANCMDPNEGHGAFWYYWNPQAYGCPMVLDQDYMTTTASIGRYANTTSTYPEYNRLFNNGVAKIMIMMGKPVITDANDPMQSNPWSYPTIRNTLLGAGFQNRQLTAGEIQTRFQPSSASMPFVEEYSLQTPRGLIHVTLFFGDTGLNDPGSQAFHRALKEGLETSSVIMYGGHAGTGKNLDIGKIKEASGISIHARPDIYQILLLSACFPYAYYTRDFFSFKGGSKNLDILSEGTEGGFAQVGPEMSAVLKSIITYSNGQGAWSYQQIINSDYNFTYSMFSVTGDEDNPTSPVQ